MLKLKGIFIPLAFLLIISCSKDKRLSHHLNNTPSLSNDSTSHPYNPVKKGKIKTSIKIHDDNVNGVFFKKANRIQEAVHYFYNEEGLLDSLAVLSDTTKGAVVLRTLKLDYKPLENKVEGYFENQQNGKFRLDFSYDDDKKVLAISNKEYHKEMGVFFIYDDDVLSHQKFDFGKVSICTNMQFDNYHNLLKYEIYSELEDFFRVQMDYDYSREVDPTFDIKFNSVDIQFLYEGGVNIIDLMGLNSGKNNRHLITRRTETLLKDSETFRNTYLYQYEFDEIGRMKNRSILLNGDTEIFFEYNY